ncbi:hypothetical protein AWM68_17515 [Fictibacillus phosphorivorans]|uniref:Uncharacterized protein n=1 Tax=Fictibacillus phosphorivorans TaxID=1221500 RepID=A0A161TPL8_9BACL|nr:hypothetical protein [Fictibacillus phosphorivorans]KZE67971.1 hypothetical protein AWM68_17515 [Fictibacillus phosphorivorans]
MKKIGLDIMNIDENNEELAIHIIGNANDELDLINKTIKKLIKQIDLKYMCSEDQDLFDKQMESILFIIAENIQSNIRIKGLLEIGNDYKNIDKTHLNSNVELLQNFLQLYIEESKKVLTK